MTPANHSTALAATASDMRADGWLRFLPQSLRACALLSRWDRPVGIWLLLWPALWGLLLGHNGQPPLLYIVIFIVGAVAMRGAGCTINDLLDRGLDGAVARTASRPLPAGLISVRGAWLWLAVQMLLAAVLLFALPPAVWMWGLAAVPLVLLYPLMKCITWWPQLWLGITFNWGLWLGLASGDATHGAGLWFYIGAIVWTVGYDTIYATQDADDDALIGVRSTARLFGVHVRAAVAICYVLALSCWVMGVVQPQLSAYAAIGFILAAGLLAWQFKIWSADPISARKAFISNIRVGAAVALMLWLGYAF